MPLIGKGVYVPNSLIFAFTLTVNGTDYVFDKNTQSSSVTDVYQYIRGDKTWDLVIYADGKINFSKLLHSVDICCVGAGGGGGGGTCGGSGYSQGGKNGGRGGGGYIVTSTKTLALNTDYTLTLGTGGERGTASGTSTWVAGTAGGDGGDTTFGSLVTAGGGKGGSGADYRYDSTDGAGGSESSVHCFSDENLPLVSGRSGRKTTTSGVPGVGGAYGGWDANYYGDPSAFRGDNGANGLIVIRSAR